MPQFKSTYNILKRPDQDEVFNSNWMDSNSLVLPKQKKWSYDRPLKIEDVDVWEVIYDAGCGWGLYAAWDPYAEFYMLTLGWDFKRPFANEQVGVPERIIETFYGPNAQVDAYNRAIHYNMQINVTREWADQEDMWLYPNQLHSDQSIK